MAIKTIRLSDETMTKYQEMHPQNPVLAIENQLEKFKDVSYKERVLLFEASVRKELEHLYGKPIEDAQEFVNWVKKAIVFKAGEVDVPLTDGQRKRMELEAKFSNQPLQDYIKSRVQSSLRMGLGA